MPKQITIVVPDDKGNVIGTAKVYDGYLCDVSIDPSRNDEGVAKSLIRRAIEEGAFRAMSIAADIGAILKSFGWTTSDGRRFVQPKKATV